MNRISMTLSANAGVSLEIGKNQIWVDALHKEKVPSFSAVSPQIQGEMLRCRAFQRPTAICYTHCHADHFSAALTQKAMALFPEVPVFLPEQMAGARELVGESYETTEGAVRLQFWKLPHEGAQYASVPHYGLMVSADGWNILLPGDCETGSDALAQFIGDRPIHCAVLPFPWLTLKRGRKFLEKFLPDAVLVFCHLPFAQDEENRYRQVTQKAVSLMPGRDIRLLLEPLQTEMIQK